MIIRKNVLVGEHVKPNLHVDLESSTFILNHSAVVEMNLNIGEFVSFEFDEKEGKMYILLDNHKEGFRLSKASGYRLRFRNKLLIKAFKKCMDIYKEDGTVSFDLKIIESKKIELID